MVFMNDDPGKAWEFRDVVIAKISIVELMLKYKTRIVPHEAGEEFTHRAYCPLHKRENGEMERTPSLYVSEKTNSFCCFGCGRAGSPIEFVSFMEGTPPIIALRKLAKDIGLIDKDGKWDELQLDAAANGIQVYDPTKTIDPYLLEISQTMKKYIEKFIESEDFEKELKWIEKIGSKVDGFVANIGHEDWEYAKEMCEKVKKTISKREQ